MLQNSTPSFAKRPGHSVLQYRLRRLWRRKTFRRGVLASIVLLLVLVGGSITFNKLQILPKIQIWFTQVQTRVLNREEFMLKTMDLRGRHRASMSEIRDIVLDGKSQVSSLEFDPVLVREKIQAIDWVRDAQVSIMNTDIILISIEEYIPAATWYDSDNDKIWILDPGGIPIVTIETRSQWRRLPLVTGNNAPQALNSLLNNIATTSFLSSRLKAAVRIGNRRWRLILNNGLQIDLPERNMPMALQILRDQQKKYKLLDRQIDYVDLRNPSEPVVRLISQTFDERTKSPK